MDWKRAKTILIVMFLVINIFLSYQLVATSRNQYRYTNSQELTSIEQYMNSKNIKFETKIPDKVVLTPSLKVKYELFDVERVKKLFFEGKECKVTEFAGGFAVVSGDVSVEVKNGVYLTYKNSAIKIGQNEVKREKCLSQIDMFIEGLKLNMGNRYEKVDEVRNGYMKMVLGQQYKKIPVESSQLEIIAAEDGVAEVRLNWFENIKQDRNLNITTPVVALLKAFENRKAGDATINVKQIRQGYYFNIDRQKDSQEGIPIDGTAFPMWVIATDQSQIYINAYTEEFEKVQ